MALRVGLAGLRGKRTAGYVGLRGLHGLRGLAVVWPPGAAEDGIWATEFLSATR